MTARHSLSQLWARSTFVALFTTIAFLATAQVAAAQCEPSFCNGTDYKTPEEAAEALVATAKSDDMKAALKVLGRDGEDILSSGDKVADERARARFVSPTTPSIRSKSRAIGRR